jgi:uncharacterized repeat protein (TIGR01451 family)
MIGSSRQLMSALTIASVILVLSGALVHNQHAQGAEPAPSPAPQPQIIGGVESKSGSWPWLVALVYTSSQTNTPFCGGALIAPQWVLTARHCTTDDRERPLVPAALAAIIGTVDLTKPAQRHTITAIRRYPLARRVAPFDGDVALLQLGTPAAQTPLQLDDPSRSLAANGALVTAIGWGARRGLVPSGGNYNFPSVAHQVELPIVDQAQCAKSYGAELSDRMLCAGAFEGGVDTCLGDSGGPVVAMDTAGQWRHVGLVSFGPNDGCAAPRFPGVSARTAAFVEWIRATIASQPFAEVVATGPATGAPQQPLTYRFAVSVANLPANVTSAPLTARLPSNTSYVSSSNGGVERNGIVTWTFDPRASAAPIERTLTVSATASTQLIEYGVQLSDGTTAQGRVFPQTAINTPLLVVDADANIVGAANEPLEYFFQIQNIGQGPNAQAQGLVLTTTLPPGVTFLSASDGGTQVGQTVAWNLPTISSGGVLSRRMQVSPQVGGELWLSDYAVNSGGGTLSWGQSPAGTYISGGVTPTPSPTRTPQTATAIASPPVATPTVTETPSPTATTVPTETSTREVPEWGETYLSLIAR